MLTAFRLIFLSAILFLTSHVLAAQNIHLNQLGFLPHTSKIAVIPNVDSGEFWLYSANTKTELLRGPLSQPKPWAMSGETLKIADFSAFDKPGRYFIRIDGLPDSPVFEIGNGIYDGLLKASVKSFYYNRSSVAIEPRFSDKFARPAGHPDTLVYVHPSAASVTRPSGHIISATKGWYDAGDYNKYIVNSGITTYTLLKAYEDYESIFKTLALDIPESSNKIPDILDEVLWNLDWMLAMQDPNDGGVYHKLTTLKFTDNGMPNEQNQARYVVQKSTAATLNFIAVMATASRIFGKNESLLPGYAKRCQLAAEQAWTWASKHPKELYIQPADVKTGIYANANEDLKDEWLWAGTEMFALTNKKAYLSNLENLENLRTLEWGDVEHLAWFSLAKSSTAPVKMKNHAKKQLLTLADEMVRQLWASGYFVPMVESDFRWGSNGVALNKALVLIQANSISPNAEYQPAARALLDYVLGRNPTDYSFVTGFGFRPPINVHHRISYYDKVKDPVPGMLVGGPHSGQQDGCKYPSKLPAKSYLDDWCSYSTNEVAINWNAALVYVLASLSLD